jgi:hypothetical protein
MNSNWFDNESAAIHQNELYRDAANNRLAQQITPRSGIVRVYAKAMSSLGNRMILWGTNLQKRNQQSMLSTAEMKAV